MTITEFLTARYDEEWELASAAACDSHGTLYDHARFADEFHGSEATPEQLQFINRHDPRRAWADITAKRAIVAEFQRDPMALHSSWGLALEWVLRRQVQPFAEHPDFDPAWRAS